MTRSFSGQPPAPEVLGRLLQLAARSPSAGNTGGWDLVVLEGAQTAAFWAATTTPEWRASARRWPGLSRAPVVVVVLADPGAYLARYGEPDKAASRLGPAAGLSAWPVPYWFVDAGMAVMSLLLGAVDAGLGACFLGNFRGEEELLAALGVPEGRRYVGAVLLGAAGGDDPPSASARRGRRRVDDVVHRGRWSP